MVMTTNRGWRSWRRDEKHAIGGNALTRDDVAELFPEQALLALPYVEKNRDETRVPLVSAKLNRAIVERRQS
jgi:hypothetical protein